jgi:ABC-type multidrug transport system ATPase subunit
MATVLDVLGVTKRLNGIDALDNVTLTISSGLTVVTGASGAGKTTLLRLLAGVIAPDTGEVTRAPELSTGWLCVAATMTGVDVPGPVFPLVSGLPRLVLCDDITFGLPRSRVGLMFEQLRSFADAGSAVVATTHRDDLPALADVHYPMRAGRLCAL